MPTGPRRVRTAPTPAPLAVLRLPTFSCLSLPFASRTRMPMASPSASPDFLSLEAAASAAGSSLKTPITSWRSVMGFPFLAAQTAQRIRGLFARCPWVARCASSVADEPRSAMGCHAPSSVRAAPVGPQPGILEPPDQLVVDRVGADERRGSGPAAGIDKDRLALPATESAVAA